MQQTPSTQKPLVHWVALRQETPFALRGRQTAVASQYWPAAQGRAALQPPEHVVALAHWLVVQAAVVVLVQAPAPLQTDALVARPFVQLGAVHPTALPGNPHAFPSEPSHVP